MLRGIVGEEYVFVILQQGVGDSKPFQTPQEGLAVCLRPEQEELDLSLTTTGATAVADAHGVAAIDLAGQAVAADEPILARFLYPLSRFGNPARAWLRVGHLLL